jgi:hypothetical protein
MVNVDPPLSTIVALWQVSTLVCVARVNATLGFPFVFAVCVDVNGLVEGLNADVYTAMLATLKLEMYPAKLAAPLESDPIFNTPLPMVPACVSVVTLATPFTYTVTVDVVLTIAMCVQVLIGIVVTV